MDKLGGGQDVVETSAHQLEEVEKLKKLYYDPKEPGSFGGVKRLSEVSGLKKDRVRKFLSGEDPYSLHFPVRYKFQRRKTIAYGLNELRQSDSVDLQKLSRFNRGYRYIFRKVFKEVRPKNIQTDKGSEYYNKTVRDLFRKHNIHHYSTKSEAKCAILERAHKTLQNKMYCVFTHRN
ncbi:hypothetical protein AVEN_216190-1 [Araneus ventricosus]|uniref:Integrase catalytic domain-containing protein n=1 Tax=Araneus ventricosus TaxID=182803 RepID=A0A4Y2WJ97_ARAVE|nr:hypothetical protein AVEN_216190-1 [Araneus ventricosus]